MQRMTLRLALTSLLACGAFAIGCGDGGGGTVITPDAPSDDVAADASTDAAGDSDAVTPPTDNPPPDDVPQVDAPADVTPMDVPDDTPPADVTPPVDVPPADVPPVDVPPVDVPPADVPPVDVPPVDVPPMDVPPVDVPPADVPPADVPPADVPPVDVPPVDAGVNGHRATSLVGAGGVMRSPSYRMVSTLGQSTIHQTVMRSTGFRLRGGVVGASGGSR